ncbi:pkinase-domain-containing protein [Mucor ambiguus]|uniref:Pkinase-domain-containing protein n=1 Tax=Mucor ambiguus TaxID=91626 RepID=A0A0C9M695_9FUNG|nr:pkinase-domain-containing protein [Mucor ambiguus]
MAATLIQPVSSNNNVMSENQVLTLLEGEGSSSSSFIKNDDGKVLAQTPSNDNLQEQQEILDYLKPSPVSSYNARKVPRLGPFLLLKTLGVGEFGKVKLGRHIETGQITLNHPYIVKLLSVNETNTNIGMVLEYAQGGELFEYIFRQRYLKEQEACRLFSQLISSVHYMHQKNIVHRDLKLENILLDRHGNLIVTDFGFANQFTLKTGDLMSTSCGSPVYAAPELVMTGRLYAGTGVDIWSCGIILYAMLCGYLPFDDDAKNPNGENIGRLYRYIMAHKPKYPSYLSDLAKDIIGKMLIPDPSERCKIQDIMAHPWLEDYKDEISKSVQELEKEAQVKKKMLLTGIQSSTNLSILADGEQYDSNEDCCNNSDHDSCSTSSSVSSSYSYTNSYSNTKDTRADDDVLESEQADDHSERAIVNEPIHRVTDAASSPTTPIPLPLSLDEKEKLQHDSTSTDGASHASCSEKTSPENEEVMKPTNMPCALENQHPDHSKNASKHSHEKKAAAAADTNKTSTLSKDVVDAKQKKRHTIDAAVTSALMQQQQQKPDQRPSPPRQNLSLRAKLLSSVKRRTTSSPSTAALPPSLAANGQKPTQKNRHSWQHLMQSHSTKDLPLTPAPSAASNAPRPLIVEHSKSERLISWLKKTKSLQHKKPKAITTTTATTASSTSNSSSSSVYSSSREAVIPEEDATIPIARPNSSLAPMRSTSTTVSRTPTLLSQVNKSRALSRQQQQQSEIDHMSIASELRVHTGSMNHSALTSKPPMEVLLEINKILLILGIQVENIGGYKLRCTRRSIHYSEDSHQNEVGDILNHLSTKNDVSTMITEPIYGHPSIDRGEEIQFLVEICRFENLSGLFSVDIQHLATVHDENLAGYQFIGQKLLSLLQNGNIIRNTNFSLMLKQNVENENH